MRTSTVHDAASRRQTLQRLAATLLAGLSLPAQPAVPQPRMRRCFDGLCDTLVPADELTPAASALGVPQTIIDALAGNEPMQRLVSAGCEWLDAQAAGDFAALGVDAREALVWRMAALPWESPPQRLYLLLRNTVMVEYYADPRAWRGLALDRPPQPLGFFDAVRS